MKKTIILSLTFWGLLHNSLCSQSVPPYFQYQAVARDGLGLLSGKTIDIEATILKNNMSGTEVYKEEHNAILTNEFGLFSLKIGGGNVKAGSSLLAIDWGADVYLLRVGFKPPGGNEFLLLNAVQLLSVPYALYAQNAGNSNDGDQDPLNEIQTLSISGANLSLSNGNTVSLAGIGSQWQNNPNGIHYTNGRVGIGTSAPDFKLDIRAPDSDAEEDVVNVRKNAISGGAPGRNFLISMRPSVPEVLLTTDGTGAAHPRLSLGAGAKASHLTILTNGNVGIGTAAPDATLEVKGTVKMFGNWEDRSPDMVYQAPTDGFVIVRLTVTGNNKIRAEGATSPDAAFDPSETRIGATAWSNADASSFTLPVSKGEYWRVSITAQDPSGTNIWVQWRPLGN